MSMFNVFFVRLDQKINIAFKQLLEMNNRINVGSLQSGEMVLLK
jgi:hypothetical protein